MKRRSFLAAALTAAAGFFFPTPAATRELNKVYRAVVRDRRLTWERIRMLDVRRGDYLLIEDAACFWHATHDGYFSQADGCAAIEAERMRFWDMARQLNRAYDLVGGTFPVEVNTGRLFAIGEVQWQSSQPAT